MKKRRSKNKKIAYRRIQEKICNTKRKEEKIEEREKKIEER